MITMENMSTGTNQEGVKSDARQRWHSVAYQGGWFGGSNPPPPEIPKISVESAIAWARRAGVSISFC